MTTFRACYWLAPDGQSDILLTGEEEQHLPDAELIAIAMAKADETGLPEHLVECSAEALTLEEARESVRRQLRVGNYTTNP